MAIREVLLNCVYILLSVSVIFLPLLTLYPRLYRIVSYYRKATIAIDKLYRPFSNIDPQTITVSITEKVSGKDKGYTELCDAIAVGSKVNAKDITSITLVYGMPDVKAPVMQVTPNTAIFIDTPNRIPVLYDPIDQYSLNTTKNILIDWVKQRTQTKLVAYTAIATVFWVVVMTILIFG